MAMPDLLRGRGAPFQTSVSKKQSPYIVPLKGFCRSARALVYPFYEGGSLETRLGLNLVKEGGRIDTEEGFAACCGGLALKKKDGVPWSPLNFIKRLQIALQLSMAVQALHALDPPIVHRDIKPANCLLDMFDNAALGDTECAKFMTKTEDGKTYVVKAGDMVLSPGYTSPEVIAGVITRACDVYALGAVFLQLATALPIQAIVTSLRNVSDVGQKYLDPTANWPTSIGVRLLRIGFQCRQDMSFRIRIAQVIQDIKNLQREAEMVASKMPEPPSAPPVIRNPLASAGVPSHFLCPITKKQMTDPVFVRDGYTYERSSFVNWFKTSHKSPMTGAILESMDLTPNIMLALEMNQYAEKQGMPVQRTASIKRSGTVRGVGGPTNNKDESVSMFHVPLSFNADAAKMAYKANDWALLSRLCTGSEYNVEGLKALGNVNKLARHRVGNLDLGMSYPIHNAAARGDRGLVAALIDLAGERPDRRTETGYNALHLALFAPSGSLETVQWLCLHAGANVATKLPDGRTPLFLAVERKLDAVARFLVKDGNAGLEDQDDSGRTALHVADETGQSDLARWLIDRGASTQVRDKNGRTVLHIACEQELADLARCVVQGGANVNEGIGPECMTPLHAAAARAVPNLELIRCLVWDCNADVHARNADGMRPMDVCRVREVAEKLEPRRIAIEAFKRRQWWRLQSAADPSIKYDIGGLRLILEAQSDLAMRMDHTVTKGDAKGMIIQDATAYHCAAAEGNLGLLRAMRDFGFFVPDSESVADRVGRTPLHLAAMGGATIDSPILKWLLTQVPRQYHMLRDADGKTFLDLCKGSGGKDIGSVYRDMVDNGPDVLRMRLAKRMRLLVPTASLDAKSLRNSSKIAPRDLDGLEEHLSVEIDNQGYDDQEPLEAMVDRLAATSPTELDVPVDNSGECLLHLAVRSGSEGLVRHLLIKGAKVDVFSTGQGRSTPLQVAALCIRRVDMAKILVNHGASLTALDWQGNTASKIAKRARHSKVHAYLQDPSNYVSAKDRAMRGAEVVGEGCWASFVFFAKSLGYILLLPFTLVFLSFKWMFEHGRATLCILLIIGLAIGLGVGISEGVAGSKSSGEDDGASSSPSSPSTASFLCTAADQSFTSTASTGSFSVVDPYVNDQNCNLVISGHDYGYRVTISKLQTELDFDILTIAEYDANADTAIYNLYYSGDDENFEANERVIGIGPGYDLELLFTSDSTYTDAGFSVAWEANSAPDLTGKPNPIVTCSRQNQDFDETSTFGTFTVMTPYADNLNCTLLVSGNENGYKVTVDWLKSEALYDYLRIYQGSISDPLVAALSGDYTDEVFVIPATYDLFIEFYSDNVHVYDGFVLTWEAY